MIDHRWEWHGAPNGGGAKVWNRGVDIESAALEQVHNGREGASGGAMIAEAKK